MDKVEVTQADLDAAKALCDYFCWVTIPDEVVQAFARHRAQALAQGRLEGVEAGLEAAAMECEENSGHAWSNDYSESAEGMGDAAGFIRNISAQTIASQIGEKP